MRTINIRQLSINLFREINELPVLVTRYGKPYLTIRRVDEDGGTPENLPEGEEPV